MSDIDVKTTLLEDTIPVDVYPPYTLIGNCDDDGIPDSMVKFNRADVIALLDGVLGDVELTVTGDLFDGRRFEGSDTIRVISKGKGN